MRFNPRNKGWLPGLVLCTSLALSACGGGKAGDDATTPDVQQQTNALPVSLPAVPEKPANDQEAARFLTQATFGPTPADVAHLKSVGYSAWIDEQLALPLTTSHQQTASTRNAASGGKHQFTHSFWEKAITAPDQLRQRMALAMSEIFVVSFADACSTNAGMGMASYYDMLSNSALGAYRSLLQSVTLHPIMGCYLSHLRNQKADTATGRVPDENYAREVMQLFSIGLVQLKLDGTPTNAAHPVETYGPVDISNLARVFTGFSWDCPDHQTAPEACFKYWGTTIRPGFTDPWTVPMRAYPQFHDGAPKTFLGKTVPAQTDPMETLRLSLDVIASHSNVAPFISKQLIQRFVTSNPSKGYVTRVATAFKNSRGHLGTTIKAVLMDPEARDMAALDQPGFGKVREPLLRMSALLRAFNASSASGGFLIGETKEATGGLSQSALFAPSVFNFFRPGYTPPSSSTSAAGLVAPELQLAHESSMAGYANFMRDTIWAGIGMLGYNGLATRPDVQMSYNLNANDAVLQKAASPVDLVETINQRLTYGTMSDNLKQEIAQAISAIDYRSPSNPTPEQIRGTYTYRVWSALLLTVVSPEFLIQK